MEKWIFILCIFFSRAFNFFSYFFFSLLSHFFFQLSYERVCCVCAFEVVVAFVIDKLSFSILSESSVITKHIFFFKLLKIFIYISHDEYWSEWSTSSSHLIVLTETKALSFFGNIQKITLICCHSVSSSCFLGDEVENLFVRNEENLARE